MIDFSLSDKLKNMYQNNLPYPYIIIDNFLPDFLLDSVLNELKEHDEWYHTQEEWVQNYEVNKFFYPNHDTNMDDLSKKIPITKFVFEFLNSPEMIKFLENLTGFTGISIDPILLGGGIHKIATGGRLAIHRDFNTHPGTKKKRVLNLLIYLNKDWKKEWNGNLELVSNNTWDKSLEIEPIFNRAVIFNIEDAPHGHPTPLNTPKDVFRYSLALYYFVDEQPEVKHSVVFYSDEDVEFNKNEKKFIN